jgi:hypothetical protein
VLHGQDKSDLVICLRATILETDFKDLSFSDVHHVWEIEPNSAISNTLELQCAPEFITVFFFIHMTTPFSGTVHQKNISVCVILKCQLCHKKCPHMCI